MEYFLSLLKLYQFEIWSIDYNVEINFSTLQNNVTYIKYTEKYNKWCHNNSSVPNPRGHALGHALGRTNFIDILPILFYLLSLETS